MQTKIIAIYKKEEEINKILEQIKDYLFDELKKSEHFEFSILEKATDLDLIKTTFLKFELIRIIEVRENEKGKKYFGLNYELEDGTSVIIALSLDKKPPVIINAYHRNTNYKKFEKSLRKNYKNKFI